MKTFNVPPPPPAGPALRSSKVDTTGTFAVIWCSLYLIAIVGVNMGFEHLPVLDTKLGPVPAMAFIVGLVFVFRDYAQRYAGHWVLLAMFIGVLMSAALASPQVAFASAAAFAVGELVDYAVYTVMQKPFHQRMLVSSAVAVPVDSAVFLLGIGFASVGGIIAMSLSKFSASLVLYSIYKAVKEDHAR